MRIAIIAVCSAVVLAGCSANNMVKAANCPDILRITPPPGKASLVIAEPMRYENYDLEDNPNVSSYLDGKFIGTANGSGIFITIVEPGRHYVVANGENFETVLLNFKAGETYYLEQERRLGFALLRTRYRLVKADRLFNDLHGKYSCYEPDVHNTGRDLDEDRFAEAVAAYTKNNGNIPVNEMGRGK